MLAHTRSARSPSRSHRSPPADAAAAFDGLFERFKKSILVLSYSSNGFPDLPVLVAAMRRYKTRVDVHERSHRYHFGTHGRVRRAQVQEYLVVGR